MSQRRSANVDPVEILRTHSSVEAEVVRGLLDAHGIEASVGSALSPSLFPMRFGQAEFRITVASAAAGRARELIAGHLDEAAASEVRRLSENLGPLEDASTTTSATWACSSMRSRTDRARTKTRPAA